MEDQEDKKQKKTESEKVREAITEIAKTEAGQVFFRYLSNKCHFNSSTIVGNPHTFDVNSIGSLAQEFQRRVYLDIRRAIPKHIRQKFED